MEWFVGSHQFKSGPHLYFCLFFEKFAEGLIDLHTDSRRSNYWKALMLDPPDRTECVPHVNWEEGLFLAILIHTTGYIQRDVLELPF